jgi:hypothetical protein
MKLSTIVPKLILKTTQNGRLASMLQYVLNLNHTYQKQKCTKPKPYGISRECLDMVCNQFLTMVKSYFGPCALDHYQIAISISKTIISSA